MMAGYSVKASTVPSALSKLRKVGYVADGQPIRITQAGLDSGDFEVLPTGPALLEFWKGHPSIGQTEWNVLEHLMKVWPAATDKVTAADATGYSPAASTVPSAMSKLRKVGIADGWKASDEFMEAIKG